MIFDAPYPGWTVISGQLTELLPAFSDAGDSISRCGLVFADRFLLSPHDEIESLFSLSHYFPGMTKTLPAAKTLVYTGLSPVKETTNEITLRYEKEKCLVLLDFNLYQVSDSGTCPERARSWFEAAHAEIHRLFDELVSDEMIARLA